jgi:zinc transport system substrate-binding protein
MGKRLGLWTLVFATVFLFAGCGQGASGLARPDGKLQVYTSIYPLSDFAKKIGGDHVQVTNLVPPGVQPHDYELSPRDMTRLSQVDLFIYNGAGFEPYADKMQTTLDTNKTMLVDSTKDIPLMAWNGSEEEKHREVHHWTHDPHVWLDSMLAKQQALAIRDALIKKDPKHKADYEKNYEELASRFNKLDIEFREMAQKALRKEFAVSHAAFGYLAKRYGLTQLAISGLSPEDEPSPQELKNIIEQVKAHHIRVILFETLVSGKLAEVVKNDVKAEASVLNPLEGLTKEELARGEDYFSIMEENKRNLVKALGVTP